MFAGFGINSMNYIFAYRSMRQSLFHMTPLNQNMPLVWAVLAGLLTMAIALVLLLAVEIGKAINRRFANQAM